MNKAPFKPPCADLYQLQRMARELSLLSPEAQRIKAKDYFSQALRFLGRGSDDLGYRNGVVGAAGVDLCGVGSQAARAVRR